MKTLALVATLLFAVPSFAQEQSDAARLARIEANTNAILSILAAHKGRMDNIEADVRDVKDEVKAIKASFPEKKFVPSTVDEWGRGNPASFGGQSSAWSASSSTYMSSGAMMQGRQPLFSGRLFGGRLLGAGKCANGS